MQQNKKAQTRRRFLSSTTRAAAAVVTSTALGRSLSATVPRETVPRERIKIGQIGVGHAHAAGKMNSYRRSPDYEVVGVVEPDPELRRAHEGSATYRDLRWMSREELLNTPGLQAVAVETRVRDLLEAAESCIEAGVHIHLDKPAGSSLPRFRRLLEAARRKSLVVQMGYMYRYNPAVVLMRELLSKGWLGEPFEVHTVMSKVVRRSSREGLGEFAGGIMFELGCHIIDILVAVLGKPEKVTPFYRHSSPIDDELRDNMLAVCEYPRAVASVKSSAQEVEGFARRHFVLCGTEGTIHIQPLDHPAARLALSRARGSYRAGYQDVHFPRYTRYVGDAKDLARIIRGEKAADFSPDHDLAVQDTVLRAAGMPVGE
ncbi:MAG: Gfo/Idh/MocA family oxidoreductase [Planctomycetota bacterium]|nr:Gfo/Idh/MocA family oxidoreductase [Planctomycetota bacterium]